MNEPISGEPTGPRDVFAVSSPRMSDLIAAKDWSSTPLGAMESWPPALRTVLDVILANRFPVVFWWGPQFIQLYNDPYALVLGTKHPKALGQPFSECWAEIWHIVGPQAESVLNGGPSTWNEDLLLEMNRHGFMEEAYFTFSYSALPDPQAPKGIGGVLGTVQETTDKVIGERRMHLLRDLAARGNEAKTVDQECLLAAQTLERYPADVPFALIYLIEPGGEQARLRAASGVAAGDPAAPLSIESDADATWRLRRKQSAGDVEPVEDLAHVLERVPAGPWPEPPHRAVVTPIPSGVPNEIAGWVVCGVSARLPYDEKYRDFYALVASQIGTAIASARAYEEERRRAEALAELDRAKNLFFSNVSHEFRTPLTLILGPLSDLLDTVDDPAKPLVEAAHRNSLRLLKLVNTLLEFSRLEAGRSDPSFAETNLAGLTAELCGVFRSAIENAGLQLEIRMELDRPVYVDRGMWEKIVLNLLSNALKFTLDGRIRVVLRQHGEAAELRVEDTGVGIPEHELPHVFERFRRVRHANARSHEGSGIGLALVKDLTELHGGSVTVRSEAGKGSAFVVRLPLGRAHLNGRHVVSENSTASLPSSIVEQYLADVDSTITRAVRVSPPAEFEGVPKTRSRLLLADDNGDLREYVTRILQPYYDVVAVTNGLQALAAAREKRFDMILSDVMMPQMDGFELLRAIREEPDLSTTTFILLSARAGEESALEGLARGADDYIAKPFTGEELLARVRANLNAAAMHEQAWELSEHRFHVFADRLPVMVYQQDPSGAVIFTNAAWHAITRLPRDPSSYDEQSWSKVIHPEDYERVISIMSGAAASRSSYGFEYRVKPADAGAQAYRWYVANAEPQYAAGAFTGWVGYVVDVHDARTREDLERSLRRQATERERAFHALAEAIPVIVWSSHPDGWLDWYNNRWYEYTGQTPEQAAGWGWQAAHHPEDFPRVMREWPRALASGERFEMEFRLRRRDGVFHWFLTRAEPQEDEAGNIVHWYGSSVDIQAQKEALDHSKRVAETLQQVFLPDALPHTDKVRFDAVYVAAEKDALVGGDWFDAAELPDGRYLVSIGDVAGHGLDASVIAGALRQAISSSALSSDDPAAILRHANRIMRFQHPDTFATALVGLVDADCRTLSYACAGHPPALLGEPGRATVGTLSNGALPLGVQDELTIASQRAEIAPDSVLVLYTDGLVEYARDIAAAERLLERAVLELAADGNVSRPALDLQRAVLGNNVPTDDVALLVAQFSRIDAEVLPLTPESFIKEWRFHSSDAHAARSARHELMKFVRRFAAGPDALFVSELILGEILANTVEHAPGLVELRIDWRGERPVITVRDTGPGFAEHPTALPDDPLDEGGRGLFLISRLAHDLSIKPAPGYGTEMKVTLPVTRAQ